MTRPIVQIDDTTLHRYMTMAGIRFLLKDTGYIWTDDGCCGGRPCLSGHRFTLHQLLKELAIVHDGCLKEIANTYELNVDQVKGALMEIAQLFDQLPEGDQ